MCGFIHWSKKRIALESKTTCFVQCAGKLKVKFTIEQTTKAQRGVEV